MSKLTRREMLAGTAAAHVFAAAPARPAVVLFSKPVQMMGYDELGRMAKRIGFDGIDLTVRAKGHVLPERVERDLPAAVEALQSHGLAVPMITTRLTSPADPAARKILSTAARLKVRYFKLGYWHYRDADIHAILSKVREDACRLAALAKECGIEAGWHNHSGDYVGHSIWDSHCILSDLDPKWIGYYYDLAHASSEGGVAGWQIGLRLALPRLKLVAVKDYLWKKVNGAWVRRTCPLGEGMVNFPKSLAMLAAGGFHGPISLHVEYQPADVVDAIDRDLAFLKAQLDRAYRA